MAPDIDILDYAGQLERAGVPKQQADVHARALADVLPGGDPQAHAMLGARSIEQESAMMNGLRTVKYPVADLARAKAWYSDVFGCAPYFDQPFYVGFAIAGFELGLVPDGQPGTQGCTAYWGVDDIEAEVARIVGLGASVHEAITDVGEGIRVAELKDPFGNLLGLILNPHFDLKAVR